MPADRHDDSSWITPEIRAAIEESEAGEGEPFESADEMLQALRSSTDDSGSGQ